MLGDVSGRLAETSTGSVVLLLVSADGASVAMDSGAAGGGVGGVGIAAAILVWGSGGLTAGAGMAVLVAAGAVARLLGLLATEDDGL